MRSELFGKLEAFLTVPTKHHKLEVSKTTPGPKIVILKFTPSKVWLSIQHSAILMNSTGYI